MFRIIVYTLSGIEVSDKTYTSEEISKFLDEAKDIIIKIEVIPV